MLSSSNIRSASVLASSVLPTPVGPRNRKEPMGLLGSLMPALERMMASATFSTASSWPTTRLCRSASRFRIFAFSLWVSLATGMPVHLEMIRAISSSVTASWTRVRSRFRTFSSSSASSFSILGSCPYFSSAAFSRLYSRSACSICRPISSFCSRSWLK